MGAGVFMEKTVIGLSVVLLIAGVFSTTPSRAGELADLKKEVQVLEKRLDSEIQFLKEEQAAARNRLDEWIALNLYISLAFRDFEKTDSFFDGQDLELISEMDFKNRMGAFFEIEFSGEEAEVEQGWFEYRIAQAFTPRFGVVLIPFGGYNLNHFSYRRELAERPVAMKSVVPVTWREAGAGFTGNTFIESMEGGWLEDLDIEYQFFFVNGFTEAFEATGSRKARGEFGDDNNHNKAVVGRIGLNADETFALGLSGYHGKYDDSSRKAVSGYDIDWAFSFNTFDFIGEYAHFDLEKSADPIPGTLRGGYVQANYHFWIASLNKTLWGRRYLDPHFTAVLRYGQAEIDGEAANNKERRWTAGINYRPFETFVARIEYQWNKATGTPIVHGDRNGVTISFSAAF